MELLLIILAIAAPLGVGVGALRMRDLVRRGNQLRRRARLNAAGDTPSLPEGRIACPECAEAILPQARRCPHCRQVVVPSR